MSTFVNERGEIRAGWRAAISVAVTLSGGFAVLEGYQGIAPRYHLYPAEGQFGANLPTICFYFLLCCTCLLTAALALRVLDGAPLATLGYGLHCRVWIEIGQGGIISFAMVTAIFVLERSSGKAEVFWSGLEPGMLPRLLGMHILFFTLAAVLEEILARGYAFQAIVQGAGKVAAVAVSSLFFALGHLANPNVSPLAIVNTGLAGVFLSTAYLKTRSLWLPTSLHMTWNLSMAFVYGFPVSGLSLPNALWRTIPAGPEWVTGGAYGPEAGAVSIPVLIAATVLIMRSRHINPSPSAAALWEDHIQVSPETDSAFPG